MKRSLGILGGTFNPIHMGHLMIAEEARSQFGLDQVLFIPNRVPPHRLHEKDDLASVEDRYTMCVLATTPNLSFSTSRIELEREGPSYSFLTVSQIKKEEPGAGLFFICGSDAVVHHEWYRFSEFLECLEGVILAPRAADSTDRALQRIKESAPNRELGKTLSLSPIDISSSNIRERILRQTSIRYLVPEPVEQYITKHALYRGGKG